jgi:anti-anti-sigma regulatory factor
MKKRVWILFCCVGLFAKDISIDEMVSQQSIEKDFLIVKTTKVYSEAKKFVTEFSKRSGIVVDLRGVSYQKEVGLTPKKEACLESGFRYPCYIARGRYDDGFYLSIEHSDAYEGFTKGYYIVMAASGEIDEKTIQNVKEFISDSYIKKSMVYMGCIH